MGRDMGELMRSCRAWARGERYYKQALQKWERRRDLDRSHTRIVHKYVTHSPAVARASGSRSGPLHMQLAATKRFTNSDALNRPGVLRAR
jgi:hypothetical protein